MISIFNISKDYTNRESISNIIDLIEKEIDSFAKLPSDIIEKSKIFNAKKEIQRSLSLIKEIMTKLETEKKYDEIKTYLIEIEIIIKSKWEMITFLFPNGNQILLEESNLYKQSYKKIFSSNIGEFANAYLVKFENIENNIKEGIDKLYSIKNDLGLSLDYLNLISKYQNNIQYYLWGSLVLFFTILILMGLSLFFYIPENFTNNNAVILYLIKRLAIILPGIWIANFIFTHYKFYRISFIRTRNIQEILQGGHISLREIIKDPEINKEIDKQIVELILDTKQITSIFSKEKEPIDKYLGQAITILKELNSINKEKGKEPIKK